MRDDLATDDVPPSAGPVRRGRKLSELLTEVAADTARDRVTVGDLLETMRDRAFGALIFIFAAPNILITPPGTSTLLAAPLIFLSLQLAIGRTTPWLPRAIAGRSMARKDFSTLMRRSVPWLVRAERLFRPRLRALAVPPAEYLIGAVCFVLAVILFLPLPLGNMLPAAALSLLALAILERDGLMALLGLVSAGLSIVLVSGVIYAAARSAVFLATKALGL